MYNKNILIGVFKNFKYKSVEYLNELENLLKVFNGKVKKKFLQRRFKPHNLTYVGKGFLKKVALYVKENLIDTVIFDDELTLSQIKNIEKEIKCIISDRTKLILDIFLYKSKTSYSKMQIKLAQYEYLLPRLTHMWSHLKRQKGGIGLRGPGEKEIETDRRLIKNSILILKKKIKKLNNQLLIQRKRRKNKVSISLIGYTNVGKSTIISKLTKKKLLIDNKFFTTLDTKVNNYYFKNKIFLIVDTIGFIRKIPTTLIESFKSTLLEIKKSDIILHIVDISSNFVIDKFLYIMNFLLKLNLIKKKIIIVFNKIDKIKNFNVLYIKNLFKNKNLLLKNNYIYFIYKKKNKIYKKKIKFIFFTKQNNIYINKLKELILMVSAGFEPATS
ncbi:GTPase HflX [Candidatus Shikimatogenerans bostrichidophilus]|uniref:GTPase HflX n=1 Tax=Candidatus Shikimatogenerans bostrichidophilus TaxID=2943807 RepID=UPI00296682B1